MSTNPNIYLGQAKLLVEKLMKYLWEEPYLVAKIIINSSIYDVERILAPLICNNFYQNIISPYTIEENLLYVITIVLKEEINDLNSENELDDFLNNSRCSYLLSELRKKNDVIIYAKTVIFNIIEKIENNNSYNILNLNMNYLEDVIDTLIKEKSLEKDMNILEGFLFEYDFSGEQKNKELKINNKNEHLKIFEIDNMDEIKIFNSKYMPRIDEKELEENMKKYKDNQDMIEYLQIVKNMLSRDKDLLSNEKIVNIICKKNHSELLLTLFQINFLKLIELLDLLIDSLVKNEKIIPKSIKYINKIIYILIKKKFPNLSTLKLNICINKFFFNKLLIPIFQNPFSMFIDDFVINDNIQINLKIILNILIQLISGNFYLIDSQIYYKPFNRYFIEKMPKIFEFYKNIINIDFTDFIDKVVNDKMNGDYNYDYFNENKNQIIMHRSICFSINNIIILINNINNAKNILFSEKEKNESKTFKLLTKLNGKYYKDILEDIKNNNKDSKFEELILLSDLLINPKYEYLFNIEKIKPYFYKKELKNISNQEESIQNNIIKSKNYISGLLYNCRDLEASEFSSKNTLDFLQEIKIYLNTSQFVIDKSLPYEWYIKSLLDCLIFLPKNLSDNDFYSFYEEIKKDINNSIKIYDFNKISDCFGKIKYINNFVEFYQKAKKGVIDLSLNDKLKNLIENKIYDIDIQFKYELNNKFFKIKKVKNPQIIDKNNFSYRCRSLNSLIRRFPDFSAKIGKKTSIKLMKIIKDLNIPNELNTYLKNYTQKLLEESKYKFTNEESVIIKNKIYDYTLKKLYYKLYPKVPSEADNIITNNCIKLSWVEPKNFKGNIKNNNYNIFIDDIKQLFNQLEKEKSPKQKAEIISEIFETITKIITFNVEESGADDILNILVYIFIQVRPKFINSDIEYIELFKVNLDGEKQTHFAHLKSACDFITNIKYNNLVGVTQEEFNEKFKI